MASIKNRKGEENYNNFGSLMIISDYRTKRDIDIYFPDYDWTFYNSDYGNFQKGTIICPYERRVYNIGFIGSYSKNIKNNKIYDTWHGMLRRCYSNEDKFITYQDCYVCEEWHCFQNFAEWYEENYYEIPEKKMHLDKDILFKGNKEYGPETCCFVPDDINSLFTTRKNHRGELPIGVSKCNKGYRARINMKDKVLSKAGFKTEHEAFLFYKENKEDYIRKIADEYMNCIPEKLYFAMYNWDIQIDD